MNPATIITHLIEANEAHIAALAADADLLTPASSCAWHTAAIRFDAVLHVIFGVQPALQDSVRSEYRAYDEQSIHYALMADNPVALKDASVNLATKIVWQQLQPKAVTA